MRARLLEHSAAASSDKTMGLWSSWSLLPLIVWLVGPRRRASRHLHCDVGSLCLCLCRCLSLSLSISETLYFSYFLILSLQMIYSFFSSTFFIISLSLSPLSICLSGLSPSALLDLGIPLSLSVFLFITFYFQGVFPQSPMGDSHPCVPRSRVHSS